MGYSHYWYRPRELDAAAFDAFTGDVRAIVATAKTYGIVTAASDATDEPEISADYFALNGALGYECEPLEISRVLSDEEMEYAHDDDRAADFYFNSCKTNFYPYDIAVMAILLMFRYRFGDRVTVSSDGPKTNWKHGFELAVKATRIVPPIDALGFGDWAAD